MVSKNKMMKNRKGQAALEFLMTYGWAILVVLAIIGVLYATVGNPTNLMPSKCKLDGSKLVCQDYKVSKTDAKLKLQNTGVEDVNVSDIQLKQLPYGGTCSLVTGGSEIVPAGESKTLDLSCTKLVKIGKKSKFAMNVTDFAVASGDDFSHVIQGTLLTVIQNN